jgi:hypothetical protein
VVLGLGAAAAFGSTSTSGPRPPLFAGATAGESPAPTPTPSDDAGAPSPTTSTFDAPQPDPTTSAEPPATDYSTVVDDVLPGDCIRDPIRTGGLVGEVHVVDCSKPHAIEVYATFDIPGASFPGQSSVHRQALAGCSARFAAFDGRSAGTSALELSDLRPTPGSWRYQDKTVRCLVGEPHEKARTGSLRNSGR